MKKDIKVFSTVTCPYCHMLKAYLTENKIEFEDINVGEDHGWAMKMVEKSQNMGVPQMWIGDKVIVGFDRVAIDQELGL